MTSERVTLSVNLASNEAALVEWVARLRTHQVDERVPVDLSPYLRDILNKDINACYKEVKERRGA